MGKKEDITTKIKIQFLEEVIGINDIDFNKVPSALVEYYIELKIRDLV